MTKADFLKKYVHCAEAGVLVKIWEAKENGATELNLGGGEITDLSPLAGLINLQMLQCSSAQVSDLSPLVGLVNLQVLVCYFKQVSNLSPLSGLVNLQVLSCYSPPLSDLSPLSGLVNLQKFSCFFTQVSDLSPLSGLVNLQELDCSSTQVSDLSPLSGLVNLQEFNCSSTQVSDLSPLSGLVNLQELDCSSTQVSDLSPLSGLVNLQEFNCSSTQVSDLSPLSGLVNLQEFNCYSTQVSDLSPLSGLVNLQKLWCDSPLVADFSPLSGLMNLQEFNCSSTQVSDLSPLSGLVNLQEFNCSSTHVSDLSPLSGLVNLQKLNCSSTQVSDLSPLSGLVNLQDISCSSTQVSDLSPLSGLVNLQDISCSSTQVSDLSPLSGLVNLQDLWCDSTLVSDLSPLAVLANLQKLNCSSTQVSDLSPLSGLVNLQQFLCSYTQVSDLSPLTGLANLHRLICDSTQVSDFRPLIPLLEKGIKVKWESFVMSKSISIQDCPLTSPPIAIAQQGNDAILRWFAENRRVGTQKVNEARLLLLGQGGSGKTTLKEKLRDKNAPMPLPEDSTRGINIELLPHVCGDGSDFTVHVWDFGGQNIQKYAHQFFLSDSVVYAVLSNEREQNPNFQYWLNIIELLGKDSPVYIVQNEREGHAEPLKDVAQIQERFPRTFRSVEQVNLSQAATDGRFEALKLKLFHEATRLPHTQKEYLTSFVNVRRKLQTLAETEHSIPFKQFKQLCRDEGITDELLMQDYAHTFTFLGIALHFSDDLFLKTSMFLRPKWMIDALFQLLYHPRVEAQAGRFSESDADGIWAEPEYDDMHGTLLRLMEKFHLCYNIEGSKRYIVPQRLPARTEPFAPPADATQVVFRYKFMPSGILTQLTCRLHHRIEHVATPFQQDDFAEKNRNGVPAYVWSDAVQFVDKNNAGRVFVREVQTEHFLEINAFGPHKADMLNQVVDILDDIHTNTKFGNLRVEKLVPCPCAECSHRRARREEAEFFNYDFLLELLRDGETESDRCRLSKRKFPIRDILKNAEVRVFKVEHIRELISADQIETALRLLRGQFDESDEVIQQMGRLGGLEREQRLGKLSPKEYDAEKNRIRDGVLKTLQALAQ